VCDQELVG